MTQDPSLTLPGHACQVLVADDIFVSHGANQGDGLMGPHEVCLGDIYQLDEVRQPLRLIVTREAGAGQRVGEGSAVGRVGDVIQLEARYALMADEGDRVELLLLALPDGSRFVVPLSPMRMVATPFSRSRPGTTA